MECCTLSHLCDVLRFSSNVTEDLKKVTEDNCHF